MVPGATTVTQVNTEAASSFLLPLGVAAPTDPTDTNVFVADPAATNGSGDYGAIFSVAQAGGSAAAVTGTIGFQPRGVVIAAVGTPTPADLLYFTGSDPVTGEANVYTLAPGSSAAPTAVLSAPGTGLNDPSGIAVDSNGNIYVVDTAGTDLGPGGTSSIFSIGQGQSFGGTIVSGLQVGYPAGLAVSGTTLYVAGRSTIDGSDLIIQIDTGSDTVTTTSAPSGISSGVEPGGLHLGSAVGTVDFVDALIGGGTVYQFTP